MSLGELIQDIKDIREQNENLHPLLMKELPFTRDVPIPGPNDWLSASRVPTWCPRYHVMHYRAGTTHLIDDVDLRGRWAMDRGTGLHQVFQELWLGPLGILWGGWRCPRCAKVFTSDGKTRVVPTNSVRCPDKCDACGHKPNKFDPMQYIEPFCYHDECLVRGPTDGIIMMPGHAPEFFDLKTTSAKGSDGLKWVREGPRQKDVRQLYWYMDTHNIRRGRIVYVDPGAREFERAMVEHVVSFDPNVMHEEKEKIRGLREALEDSSRPVPPCPYGGQLPYGDCLCVELAVQRTGDGFGPGSKTHWRGGSFGGGSSS